MSALGAFTWLDYESDKPAAPEMAPKPEKRQKQAPKRARRHFGKGLGPARDKALNT